MYAYISWAILKTLIREEKDFLLQVAVQGKVTDMMLCQ